MTSNQTSSQVDYDYETDQLGSEFSTNELNTDELNNTTLTDTYFDQTHTSSLTQITLMIDNGDVNIRVRVLI